MGSQSHPAKSGQQPEASLAWTGSNPRLRSVDSQCIGRVIESRNSYPIAGADAIYGAEGNTGASQGPDVAGPAGIEEQGMCTRVLQEPGSPCRLHAGKPEGGNRHSTPPGPSGRRCGPSGSGVTASARTGSAGVVRPSEGNEARAEGRQGVGASHSTGEAGELSPRGPGGGKGMPNHGTVERQHDERTEAHKRVNETATDSDAGPAGAADGLHVAGSPHRH